MSSDLQRLVDSLGARLDRSVAIDDSRMRLLAYTAHMHEVDDARLESIMSRGVPPKLIEYVNSQGASNAIDVFDVAACPEIGLGIARIGMPIVHGTSRLGFVWLLGSDGQLSEDHAHVLREGATQASLILHGSFLADEVVRGRERELVRDLVSPDGGLRHEAADSLIEEDLIVAGSMSALVATLPHERGEALDEQSRFALHMAVDHVRHRFPFKRVLTLSRPDHALLLAVWPGSKDSSVNRSTEELAATLLARVRTELGQSSSSQCWVGMSAAGKGLAEAHRLYGEARRAADVARITGAVGPIVSYERLGVYALLAKLPRVELAEAVHPGLRALLGPDSPQPDLVESLEVFLENAGDVKKTSMQLHIHRATLYHRLHRVEELTSLDLSRGDDRLAAHLSLKLVRLIRPE